MIDHWVVTTNQPFNIVDSPEFKRVIACASNGAANLFGRMTVARDIEDMHSFAVEWIRDVILKVHTVLYQPQLVYFSDYNCFIGRH